MSNPDFGRLIRSEEIQKAVRPSKKNVKHAKYHRNPLKRTRLMLKLNPYAAVIKRAAILELQRKKDRAVKTNEKRGIKKAAPKKAKVAPKAK